MAISIRVIFVGLLLLVAICTALIAFLPIHAAAIVSLDQSVDMLQAELSKRLKNDLQGFFNAPMQGLSSLYSISQLGLIDSFDYNSLPPPIADYVWRNKLNAYVGNENGGFVFCRLNANSPTGLSCSISIDQPIPGAPRPSSTWAMDNKTFARVVQLSASNSTYNPRTRPWYPPLIVAQGWSALYVESGGGYTDVTAGAPLYHKALGRNAGVIAVDIRTDNVLNYLSKTTVGKTGIVILVERSSRNVLGGNWNESSLVAINASAGLWRMTKFADYKNPLLHRTLSAIGEDTFFNATKPFSTAFDSGLDRVRVSYDSIADSFGLDLVMIIMIPEKDFKGELTHKVNSSIGAVVGAVIGIVLISMVLVYWLFQPLKRVEARMEAAASFDDDAEDDKNSFLSEIQTIQTAYSKMQKQLRKVKSYLPQSVRAKFDDGEYSESESVMPADEEDGASESSAPKNSSRTPGGQYKSSHRDSHAPSNDTKSVRSSRSRLAASGSIGLNVDTGMTYKKVSVLVFNLKGYHGAIRNGASVASSWQQSVLTLVERVAAAQKGIIDNFQGDHVFVTFNACTNVPTHAARAGHTALQILSALEKEHSSCYNGCSIGLAMGDALTGNCGTANLKRFNIAGPVFNQAMVLERLCKLCNVSSLLPQSMALQLEHEFYARAVDLASMPGTGKLAVLFTLIGAKSGAADEWLYEIERSKAQDKFSVVNAAWGKYAAGDSTAAAELLKADDMDATAPEVLKLKDTLTLYPDPTHYVKKCIESEFYSAAFLPPSEGVSVGSSPAVQQVSPAAPN
jgi:class 3 adenylate cyclase